MRRSHLLLIIVVMFYSGNLLIGKSLSDSIPPLTLTMLRFLIAFLVVLPLGLKDLKKFKTAWKIEWKVLVGLSLTGIVLFNLLIYISLNHTTSINAAIVESTTPIFALILGFIFLKERFNKIQLIGVVISLIGVFIVITKGSVELIKNLSFNYGDITMFLAVFFWSIYSILIKKHNWKFPLYSGLLIIFGIGLLFLIPLSLFEISDFTHINWTLKTIISVLYLGIGPSVIALILWNKAVGQIGPSRSSIYLNLLPVFTAFGAMMFLDEVILPLQITGGIMVLVGVILTTKEKLVNKKESKKTA